MKKSSKRSSKKSSTKEVAGPSPSREQSVSVTIRKIDNGYVTRRSEYKGDTYRERETFSPTKPKIDLGGTCK